MVLSAFGRNFAMLERRLRYDIVVLTCRVFAKNKRILSPFQLFDRETRREKVIEAKNRELRLKMKTRAESVEEPAAEEKRLPDSKDPILIQAEQDYNATIETVCIIFHFLINIYSFIEWILKY